MGREILFKNLKSKGRLLLITGICFALVSLFMIAIFIPDGFHPAIVCFTIILIVAIILIYFGVDFFKGENSKYIKRNPTILTRVDDLFKNAVYNDNFVVISDKLIASKDDLTNIADLNDVLVIYENIQRMNGIVVSHDINLELRKGKTIAVCVYGKKGETTDNILLTISKYCPNAMVGYTNESISYLSEQRKLYKQNK